MALTEKIKFTKDFDPYAKHLIKKLCKQDLSERYGNLMVSKLFYLFSKCPPFFSTTNWHLSKKFKKVDSKVEVFIF